ncbi:MAG: YihY/virulence factor BrkB family protein [Tissierellia bacterium]|nr:YihY/virulence factor BrkB family protein [Tissierellia bacterium]
MNKMKRKIKEWANKPFLTFVDVFLYYFVRNRLTQSAAALSYFFALAIFPFLIALLNIVRFIDISFVPQLLSTFDQLPQAVRDIFVKFLADLQSSSSATLLTVSLIATIYVASNGVRQVILSINDIYDYVETRSPLVLIAMSFFLTLFLFFLIILLFVMQGPGKLLVLRGLNFLKLDVRLIEFISGIFRLVPMLYMILIFYLLYRVAPSWKSQERPKTSSTLISATVATLGIVSATLGFSYYVEHFSNYNATYGSLAGIVVFLVWLYLFGLMILAGGAVQATIHTMDSKEELWPRKETLLAGFIGGTWRVEE